MAYIHEGIKNNILLNAWRSTNLIKNRLNLLSQKTFRGMDKISPNLKEPFFKRNTKRRRNIPTKSLKKKQRKDPFFRSFHDLKGMMCFY